MEQALIISIPLSDADLGGPDDDAYVESLDVKIEQALDQSSVGEWDGHEFGGGWARIFCYGADADALFDALVDVLLASELRRGAFLTKRYGPPGSSERVVQLGAGAAN